MILPILFQDDNYIAINKPPRLLVHRSPIDKTETRFAIQTLRNQIGQHVFPIHRLDKPTSGVLLFALNSDAAAKIQGQFKAHTIKKDYLAIVRGHTPSHLHIDHPVKPQKDKHLKKNTEAKPAVTSLTTLATTELDAQIDKYKTSRYSLVNLSPLSGRRHQLRYHMKHISHPIIGDAKYGKSKHNHYFDDKLQCSRLLLAATKLGFIHPYTDKPIQISASPGQDFIDCIQQLGWNYNHDETL